MRFGHFIIESIRHPKQIGTITEISRFLAKKIVQEINGTVDVVEFGPGTGSITREILRHLPENIHLTCFEINRNFCKYVETFDDSRLRVNNEDAQNCSRYVDGLDCIVSGLPLNLIGISKREKTLELSSESKTYIQFQYTPFLRTKMNHYFQDVKVKFVLLNFPPVFIYICKNPIK